MAKEAIDTTNDDIEISAELDSELDSIMNASYPPDDTSGDAGESESKPRRRSAPKEDFEDSKDGADEFYQDDTEDDTEADEADSTEDEIKKILDGEDTKTGDSESDIEDETAEPAEATEATEPAEPTGTELSESELQRLVVAGQRSGLTEEQITKTILNNPEILTSIANKFDASSEPITTEEKEDIDFGELSKPLEIDIDLNEVDEKFVDSVVKPMQERINHLTTAMQNMVRFQQKADEQQEAVQLRETRARLDTYFDAKTELYPTVGSSQSLTEATQNARHQVCVLAKTIAGAWTESTPLTYEQALDKAMLVKYGDTKVSSLVAKLKANQKRLTSRPTHRKTAKSYASAVDKATADLDSYMEAQGIK